MGYVSAVKCTAEGSRALKHLFEVYKAKCFCRYCRKRKDVGNRKDCEGCGAPYENDETVG